MLNLYWSVYKNLEKEVLKLSEYINFSDDQSNVYSMHIADLIVRCAIEIEAISKELYVNNGGPTLTDENGNERELYFDTDCIEFLEKIWNLGEKEIEISGINFYFNKTKVFAPLKKANKRGTSGSKWKRAYQAIKHDRKNSLKKGNIKSLIEILGALYILNLYYKNDKIKINYTNHINMNFGSDIFSIYYCKATNISLHDNKIHLSSDELKKSIYIVRYNEKILKYLYDEFFKVEKISQENFLTSPKISKFLEKNPNYPEKSINHACMDIGGKDLLEQIIPTELITKFFEKTQEEFEIVPNIYTNINDIYNFLPSQSDNLKNRLTFTITDEVK